MQGAWSQKALCTVSLGRFHRVIQGAHSPLQPPDRRGEPGWTRDRFAPCASPATFRDLLVRPVYLLWPSRSRHLRRVGGQWALPAGRPTYHLQPLAQCTRALVVAPRIPTPSRWVGGGSSGIRTTSRFAQSAHGSSNVPSTPSCITPYHLFAGMWPRIRSPPQKVSVLST